MPDENNRSAARQRLYALLGDLPARIVPSAPS